MRNHVPKTAIALMTTVYKRIFPEVNKELDYWQKRAEQIPNQELRTQALASISTKRFHCQGGAVYALLAGSNWQEAIRFIVSYQTISDYLDNLCDRSTSMDPDDFRLLHQAMADALIPGNEPKNYYELRNEQADGGYLTDLVQTCQNLLNNLDGYSAIQDKVLALEKLYGDLQVHKHVKISERIPRLTNWFKKERGESTQLSWYEFSAASGSTLGIFCLISYTLGGKMNDQLAKQINRGYFPYMQGLHILLDYYIDQQEDREEGDLNFCSYYPNREEMKDRLLYFIDQVNLHIQYLPDYPFHEMVRQGLVGLYLADPKVRKLSGGKTMTKTLLKASGGKAKFFYRNVRIYHFFDKTVR